MVKASAPILQRWGLFGRALGGFRRVFFFQSRILPPTSLPAFPLSVSSCEGWGWGEQRGPFMQSHLDLSQGAHWSARLMKVSRYVTELFHWTRQTRWGDGRSRVGLLHSGSPGLSREIQTSFWHWVPLTAPLRLIGQRCSCFVGLSLTSAVEKKHREFGTLTTARD